MNEHNSQLLDETMVLLRAAPVTRRQIAEATGLDINWMQKLSCGRIHDPGVRKIERLHGYLSGLASQANAA